MLGHAFGIYFRCQAFNISTSWSINLSAILGKYFFIISSTYYLNLFYPWFKYLSNFKSSVWLVLIQVFRRSFHFLYEIIPHEQALAIRAGRFLWVYIWVNHFFRIILIYSGNLFLAYSFRTSFMVFITYILENTINQNLLNIII